jgi:hypothetical protein
VAVDTAGVSAPVVVAAAGAAVLVTGAAAPVAVDTTEPRALETSAVAAGGWVSVAGLAAEAAAETGDVGAEMAGVELASGAAGLLVLGPVPGSAAVVAA